MITDGKKYHYLAVKNCQHYVEEQHQIVRKTFIA